MQNQKDDSYYSRKLAADLAYVRRHMQGISSDAFAENEILQDAMMFRLIQISENARRLTDEYKAEYPQIPWGDVYGLRNRIVHDYGAVDLNIVYTALSKDIPYLYEILSQSLE